MSDAKRLPVADEQLGAYLDGIVQLPVNQKNLPNGIENGGGTPAPAVVSLTADAQVALGLSGSPDSAAISAAVVKLAAAHEKLKKEVEEGRQKRAEALVDLAVQEGRITADRREAFVKLALADYETTQTTLADLPAKQSLGARIKGEAGGGSIPAERKAWNLCRWMREDMPGLERLKANDPAAYAELLKRV